jgi:hypothetical protein
VKNKHIFSLLDRTFTTVVVAFAGAAVEGKSPVRLNERDGRVMVNHWADGASAQGYTYKAPLAWNVVAGDKVIVDSPRGAGLTIATVLSVDVLPNIDVDADFDYKWLVQKVDLTEHEALVERERAFGETMLEVERTKQRESLVNSFRDTLPAGSAARALFEATTATMIDAVVVPNAEGQG